MKAFYKGLLHRDRISQREFYDFYSPRMLSVCRTYVSDLHHAEDCMVKGFVKIFNQIHTLQEESKLLAWCKKIVINECLNFIRTEKKVLFVEETHIQEDVIWEHSEGISFDAQDLLDELPEGYKMVFNLYVLEEFSHKEIAEMLGITESTSKTQLYKARHKLKNILLTKHHSYTTQHNL